MKNFSFLLLTICATLAFCSAYSIPLALNPDFDLVKDRTGNWHAISLMEDFSPETFFNPASDIYFRLYTSDNPTTAQTITLTNPNTLTTSNFNASNPTKVIIHGWNNNGNSPLNVWIRDAFLQIGSYNVIVVDWGLGANYWYYPTVVARVPSVGQKTGDLLHLLHTEKGVHPGTVTIIGHSVGAHAAGFAGKRLQKTYELTLGSILGLDAASLGYSEGNTAGRLHTGDAVYVQTIHSSKLGFQVPIGHGSFFPNGGSKQPFCGADIFNDCSHGVVIEYYVESIILSPDYEARQCQDFSSLSATCTPVGPNRVMGGAELVTDAIGVFYLTTKSTRPFSLGASGA